MINSGVFIPTGFPSLTVPSVSDYCIWPGFNYVLLLWEVIAVDSDDRLASCSSDQVAYLVGPKGGIFSLAYHTVTCQVRNNAGCLAEKNISFSAAGESQISGHKFIRCMDIEYSHLVYTRATGLR